MFLHVSPGWRDGLRQRGEHSSTKRSNSHELKLQNNEGGTASAAQQPPLLASGRHDTRRGQKNKGWEEERRWGGVVLGEEQHHCSLWCEQTRSVIFEAVF